MEILVIGSLANSFLTILVLHLTFTQAIKIDQKKCKLKQHLTFIQTKMAELNLSVNIRNYHKYLWF
jgi:hypothetical protein